MNRVALYSRGFDPPNIHDRNLVELLLKMFSGVLILPRVRTGGFAVEGESVPIHRAAMLDLNFASLPRTRVAMGDLEGQQQSLLGQRIQRLKREGAEEVSLIVPVEALDRSRGECRYLDGQPDADTLWQKEHFTILVEFGSTVNPSLLPPHHSLLQVPHHVDSQGLRSLIYHRDQVDGLLVPNVRNYIQRHGLFQGAPLSRESRLRFREPPRLKLFFDERNPNAVELAAQLKHLESDNPELIITIGGDGTMLRAIRQFWRMRIPFFGLNKGHLGFLLNEPEQPEFWLEDIAAYQLPLLLVEAENESGEIHRELAFNDTWVERETGQSAWLQVHINETERMAKVVADGMLVSTAAGSTSYARAMGATPVPFNTSVLILAGSNVLSPPFWRPAVLPLDSRIQLTTLDPIKRPLKCYIDGVAFGNVRTVKVRTSRTATVELAFTPGHDPTEKLALQQFPDGAW
jgi:NAD+ kinase